MYNSRTSNTYKDSIKFAATKTLRATLTIFVNHLSVNQRTVDEAMWLCLLITCWCTAYVAECL